MDAETLKAKVRDKYGRAARGVSDGGCCGGGCDDPMTTNLYGEADVAAVPAEAIGASAGVGNPTALAELKPGQTVLDLGSGVASTCCSPRVASLRAAGPYGLDMTDDMLAIARGEQAQERSGERRRFSEARSNTFPCPTPRSTSIISNCVINLSGDKDQVLREAFRVLKPGGHFAVSDVVVRGTFPDAVRKSMELWVGCIAGALGDAEYVGKLAKAGFADISLEDTRVYDVQDARAFLAADGLDAHALATELDGTFVSAFVRATKPLETCCAPSCCS